VCDCDKVRCCVVQVFNLAWPQHFTLEEFLRDVEVALGVEERQQFHSDDNAANLYLYPTVQFHTFLLNCIINLGHVTRTHQVGHARNSLVVGEPGELAKRAPKRSMLLWSAELKYIVLKQ